MKDMKIEETIAHAREVAAKKREGANFQAVDNIDSDIKANCIKCAEEHEQLADWLEDYANIKNWKAEIIEGFCQYDASSFEELIRNVKNQAINEYRAKLADNLEQAENNMGKLIDKTQLRKELSQLPSERGFVRKSQVMQILSSQKCAYDVDKVIGKIETSLNNVGYYSIMTKQFKKDINMWNKFPDIIPPNVPETEDFGIDYEVKYKLPNGKIETTITEWLWEKKWNCIYPVVAWRKHFSVIPFKH